MQKEFKKHILVVDDEAEFHFYVDAIFSGHPIKITNVFDGEEAISAIKREQFDIILLDLLMPNASGGDFMRGIRSLSATLPPIIVISSINDIVLQEYCLNVGAVAYFNKPVDPDFLRTKIFELIRLTPEVK
ncbi:MAG: response regulator [Chloroherpetonaceae bacterium]|nr:response regulator [Chloroherpetonaceae bacterium]